MVAAMASYYAEKVKPFLFVRIGDAPAYRFWTERANYFNAYARLVTSNEKPLPAPIDGEQIALSTLPSGCRPTTVPNSAMVAAKTDRFEGSIILILNESGSIEGMVVDGVPIHNLRVAAVDLFQSSLRSPNCIVKWGTSNRRVQIPFRFQFR